MFACEDFDKLLTRAYIFAQSNTAALIAVTVIAYVIVQVLFSKPKTHNKRNVKKYDPDNIDVQNLVAGDVYHLCTTGTKDQTWFTLGDCLYRYSLVFGAHYWNVLTCPAAYFYYTLQYNKVWYGLVPGTVLSCFYLVMPFALMIKSLYKILRDKLTTSANWMTDCPGNVFFLKPPNPIASIIWDFYLDQSLYVGQFYLVGTDKDAIQHTWYDTILTKDFWGKTMTDMGARIPLRLGRWKKNKFEVYHPITNQNLVIKLPDSYLGIGDSFWNHGTDYNNLEELETKLMETYGPGGKFAANDAIVMECVVAKKDIFQEFSSYKDVHSIDIITIRTPDDGVKVLSVLLWADCTTGSSHSTRAGYTIDVETETVQDACGWYSTFFTSMATPLKGMKIDGIKKACAAAVQGHKNIEHKWLTVVGWDCMVMEDEVVFFEGNFAGARTPRRIFLSFSHFKEFICSYFWPFGNGNSSTPGFQGYE